MREGFAARWMGRRRSEGLLWSYEQARGIGRYSLEHNAGDARGCRDGDAAQCPCNSTIAACRTAAGYITTSRWGSTTGSSADIRSGTGRNTWCQFNHDTAATAAASCRARSPLSGEGTSAGNGCLGCQYDDSTTTATTVKRSAGGEEGTKSAVGLDHATGGDRKRTLGEDYDGSTAQSGTRATARGVKPAIPASLRTGIQEEPAQQRAHGGPACAPEAEDWGSSGNTQAGEDGIGSDSNRPVDCDRAGRADH